MEHKNIIYSENSAELMLNPKIYPLDVIHSAAYIMIDRAFILLDGDPEKEIVVSIEPKADGQEIKEIVKEFNEELLNYSVYKIQSEKNKDIRDALVKRVLITNEVINCMEEIKRELATKVNDSENILKPWEEQNAETNNPDE